MCWRDNHSCTCMILDTLKHANMDFDGLLQDYLKESGLECTQAVMDDVKYVCMLYSNALVCDMLHE